MPSAGAGGKVIAAPSTPEAGTGGSPSNTPKPAGAGGQPSAAGTGGQPGSTAPMDIARSTVAPNTAPSIPEADFATYITNVNKSGLELGQKNATDNDFTKRNLIYSPLSATIALSMTYAGARGQTAAEMKTALGDTFTGTTFHTATNRLIRELGKRQTMRASTDGNTHKIELNIADTIFVERTLKLELPFLDLLSREYDSGIRQLDFMHMPEPARATINAWVEEQTKDKIKELLPMGSIGDDTRLVLVNALYFYGSWLRQFPPAFTNDAPFTNLAGSKVQAKTMRDEFQLNYRATDQFEITELPYEGNQLRMTIILPKAGQFEAVRSQVSASWLNQAVTGLQSKAVVVSLPKFKVTAGSFSLKSGLEALGMKQAFTDAADFSGMVAGGGLMIADVLQKAFIEIDENGTEAAAATAVIAKPASAPVEPPIQFTVDRPFLFFIRDANGIVLFSGHVVDPTQTE